MRDGRLAFASLELLGESLQVMWNNQQQLHKIQERYETPATSQSFNGTGFVSNETATNELFARAEAAEEEDPALIALADQIRANDPSVRHLVTTQTDELGEIHVEETVQSTLYRYLANEQAELIVGDELWQFTYDDLLITPIEAGETGYRKVPIISNLLATEATTPGEVNPRYYSKCDSQYEYYKANGKKNIYKFQGRYGYLEIAFGREFKVVTKHELRKAKLWWRAFAPTIYASGGPAQATLRCDAGRGDALRTYPSGSTGTIPNAGKAEHLFFVGSPSEGRGCDYVDARFRIQWAKMGGQGWGVSSDLYTSCEGSFPRP